MCRLDIILDELIENRIPSHDDLLYLVEYGPGDSLFCEKIRERAEEVRKTYYSNRVYIRGLIEVSNYCKNDCLYCGIRRSNTNISRFRLTIEDIKKCVKKGYELGFRTFVLQGGEDGYFSDDILCKIVGWIKESYPDCAVTLSLGERSFDSYKRLFSAGADRYLLRHETADESHYARLHPDDMSFKNRMDCLQTLKDIGFQVGCGFMVGSPYQNIETLAKDLEFIYSFKPHMVGIGPFISHRETPFKDKPNGTASMTVFLLSVIRLLLPDVLLPATTALGSISKDGRNMGILAGANVVMPNLSPKDAKEKYEIYENKAYKGLEAAENLNKLKEELKKIGYSVVTDIGNHPHFYKGQ